jgi:ferrous iron transport protein B
MGTEHLTVALAGNPNTGKSTVFNHLTGSRQHVGNWPGKTVEKKQGRCRRDGVDVEVVDLPGTYSLSAYSTEEIIARDFIVEGRPDVVVVVVDAANLERNLYLVVQVCELGAPVVVALNMSDRADSLGLRFDVDRLEQALGARVVPTTARDGSGIDDLLDAVIGSSEESAHDHR